MFYVQSYYEREIIGTFQTLDDAMQLAKDTPDSIVFDENNTCYYVNVELPF